MGNGTKNAWVQALTLWVQAMLTGLYLSFLKDFIQKMNKVFISIILCGLLSCDSIHKYSLSMKDSTLGNEQVILQSLFIDNEKVRDVNNVILTKLDSSKYQQRKELAYFSKKGDFPIRADFIYKSKVISASCKIQQEQHYCSILVTFLGSNTLHCVCDF